MWQKILLLTLLSLVNMLSSTEVCTTNLPVYRDHKNASFIIGGLFPLHVYKSRGEYFYNRNALLWVEAMTYTINDINNNPDILPGFKLGYEIYDTCNSISTAIEQSLRLTKIPVKEMSDQCPCANNTRPVVALIGDASSYTTTKVASIFSALSIPQISYSATSTELSSKHLYPSFFRTIPADNFQALTITDLLLQFNWRYINIIGCDDSYGRVGINTLLPSLSANNICVAIYEVYNILDNNNDKRTEDVINRLAAEKQATVIVLWCQSPEALKFLQKASEMKLQSRTWIATEAYASVARLLELNPNTVQGLFGVIPSKMLYEPFEQHIKQIEPNEKNRNPWIDEYWTKIVGCQKVNLTYICPRGAAYLDNINKNKYMNVMNSIYAVSHALHDYIKTSNYTNEHGVNHKAFLEYVKQVKFQSASGTTVSFDKYGNPGEALYSITNIKFNKSSNTSKHEIVGSWSFESRKINFTDSNTLQYSSGTNQAPISSCRQLCYPGSKVLVFPNQPCCWKCIKCQTDTVQSKFDQGECFKCPDDQLANFNQTACVYPHMKHLEVGETRSLLLIIFSVTTFVYIIVVIAILTWKRKTPVVKALNIKLSTIQLLSMFSLTLLPIISFSTTQTKLTCALQLYYFVGFYSAAISVTFTKADLLLAIYKASKLGILSKRNRVKTNNKRYFTVFIFTLFGLVLSTLYLILNSSRGKVVDYSPDGLTVTYDCGNHFDLVLYLSLVYIGIIALICCVYSFKARKLPEIFNEACYNSFAMFIFLLSWLMFIPIYYSSESKFERLIYWCFNSLFCNLCMFTLSYLPKAYIIIFKPQDNTKEKFREKMRPRAVSQDLGLNSVQIINNTIVGYK